MKALMRQGAVRVLFLAALSFLIPSANIAQESNDGARKVVVKTAAVYPTLARSMNIHGVVKLEAVVEPNGTVKNVEVKGGHPLLTQSAVTAVGHWRFEPTAHETREAIEIKFAE
ncbi:MAG TPA: energy transducer TonB [Candidatus Sulfotelmatobacter sp.]|nr:energy transducer TonB [Candidatus Sulfotelmatobacter sp.]